jgi:zinc D-Ala-D-Ala dipeptidase
MLKGAGTGVPGLIGAVVREPGEVTFSEVMNAILLAGWLSLAALCLNPIEGGRAADFVDVQRLCPGIRVELRYGTPRNGIGRAVYPKGARCLLRRAVAERLCRVQERLERQGYSLLVWDGYRPLSAQRALWKAKPDPRFVARPWVGGKHNRGAAVDVTLADSGGKALPMPTDFDDFSSKARADYAGGPRDRRHNRDRLRDAMRAEGFQQDRREWWHFQSPEWSKYPVEDVPLKEPGAGPGRRSHRPGTAPDAQHPTQMR